MRAVTICVHETFCLWKPETPIPDLRKFDLAFGLCVYAYRSEIVITQVYDLGINCPPQWTRLNAIRSTSTDSLPLTHSCTFPFTLSLAIESG